MENLLMQYKNNTGCTYRKMARKINNILANKDSIIRVSHETVEDYAKSKKTQPRFTEVSDAMAELVGCTTAELLASIRAVKKAG